MCKSKNVVQIFQNFDLKIAGDFFQRRSYLGRQYSSTDECGPPCDVLKNTLRRYKMAPTVVNSTATRAGTTLNTSAYVSGRMLQVTTQDET